MRCYVWGTAWGGRSHALSQFCVHVYLYLHYTSSHPTSTQYSAFYTAEPSRAHTYGHTYPHAYVHAYAHTTKRCLDPPRGATIFGAQHRQGVVQFAHAPHTATGTSTITPTKNICAASSAYQILCYTCVLHIRHPMQASLLQLGPNAPKGHYHREWR